MTDALNQKNVAQDNADGNIQTVSDEKFTSEIDALIDRAEETRLQRSRQYTGRMRIYYTISVSLVIISITWLAWGILMGGNLGMPIMSIAAAFLGPVILYTWMIAPVAKYRKEFKDSFMPTMAKALGDLTFHPQGGIGAKILAPAKILPPCTEYKAEDCFRGKYKGVGIMISEARMFHKKKKDGPVFRGVLVLLTAPKGKFKGHTIVTSDLMAIKRYPQTRWKGLQEVTAQSALKNFKVFTSQPDEGRALADADFMELMQKLSKLFATKSISSAFYGGNRVLIAIPNEEDMFEPGNINLPFTTKTYAMKCKREIEQILNIADIIDVYEADSAPSATSAAPEAENIEANQPVTPPPSPPTPNEEK